MSEKNILGCLVCHECSRQSDEYEVIGETKIPTALRDVIGVNDGRGWLLSCGHRQIVLGFFHPEEFVTTMRAPRLHEPLSAELIQIVENVA
jgi:hypothetical protein